MAHEAPSSNAAEHLLARRVQAALVTLTRETLRRAHDLPGLLRQITEVVAQTLEVARVSIWKYRDGRNELVCQDLYCATVGDHSSGTVLATGDFPAYFAALEERGVVAAADARTDVQTREFTATYLVPLGITSMLDVPIHLFEQNIGVLCHEHVGPPRVWHDDERTFAVAAANLISLALERAERLKTAEQLRASEAKYRTLVETSNDLIWSVDIEGRWTFVNRQAVKRIYGYEPEEMLGRPFTDFETPERAAVDLQTFARVKSGNPVFSYETDHLRKDGKPINLSYNAVILRDEDGRVAGATGTAADITERKAAERVIRESEERYRSLVEMLPDAVALLQNERFVYANPAFARLIRVADPTQISGLDWRAVTHPEDQAEVQERVARVMKYGQTMPLRKFRLLAQDGTQLTVESRSTPGVFHGRPAVLVVLNDITERLQAEVALRDRDERLRQQQVQLTHVSRLSAVGEMVAGITHELQQPLYAIANFASSCTRVLERDPPADLADVRHWASQISHQAQRAKQILSRLRDFTRKAEYARQTLDLNTVFSDTLEFMAEEARRRRVMLEHLLSAEPLPVEGDAVQLQQVFVNLLQNAFEAVEESPEPNRRVQVQLSTRATSALAQIRDWGLGLPPEVEPERLFEPFFTTKRYGLGIGLAITRTIVEEHGGRISVKAMPDAGVILEVELPLLIRGKHDK